MAVLHHYNSQIHDIYSYATDKRVPIGYSNTCQSASIIDWSGTLPRNREFCRSVHPIQVNPFLFIDWSNINFWNPCTYAVVLISPRHGLVCQHYRGTHNRPNERYSFLGKSGVRHEVAVTSVTLSVGPDLTLLEFDRELPKDDLKIYDHIAHPAYIPRGTHLWTQDPNGKVYRSQYAHAMQAESGNIYGYQYFPLLDGINDPGGINGNFCIFVGDSGSPTMIYDEHAKNTVLVGLMYGGQCINETTFVTIQNILNAKGYSLVHQKLSAKQEDLNQDGKIDSADLALLLNRWNSSDSYADLNADGIVDSMDLSILLNSWGDYEISTSYNPVIVTPPVLPPSGGTKPQEEKPRE